jgi:hypothetical protein
VSENRIFFTFHKDCPKSILQGQTCSQEHPNVEANNLEDLWNLHNIQHTDIQPTSGLFFITRVVIGSRTSSSVTSVTSSTVTQVTSLPSGQDVTQMTSLATKAESGYYNLPEVQSLLLEISLAVDPLPLLYHSPLPLLHESPYFHSERMVHNFYPTFCPGKLHMQMKLLGIISGDCELTGQLLTIHFAFIKYLRKKGNTV